MSNDSRFVVVTGASGGIGRAVCARLAQSGRGLVLAARAEGRLFARCDELRSVRPGRYAAIQWRRVTTSPSPPLVNGSSSRACARRRGVDATADASDERLPGAHGARCCSAASSAPCGF